MPRYEASLPAIDDNSAEALRARALRVRQFAWDFPNEAANLLAFAAELEAGADALIHNNGQPPRPTQVTVCRSHRDCKEGSVITFRHQPTQGPQVVG